MTPPAVHLTEPAVTARPSLRPRIPSPSRRGAMLALALGGFGIGTTEFASMGLLPAMASATGVSEPVAGHFVSAYALGVVVGAPVIAALAARVERRTLLIALMGTFVIGNLATALAPGYETLLAARFLAGLPHGAYFGVAALVAAHLAEPGKRAKAVATVMMGLSVANVIGVPATAFFGQILGWRSAFAFVVLIGIVTLVVLARLVPPLAGVHVSNPVAELGALRRGQVWMTLIFATVGFGGSFAVYTYISSTLTDVSGLPHSMVPVALMLFGSGMILGNVVGGRIADNAVVPGLFGCMIALICVLALFVVAAHNPVTALIVLFFIGMAVTSIFPAVQSRLMDAAGDAKTLASTLIHSAFNLANAGGAWIGGVVIAAGYGYTAPAAVGALLGVAGLIVLTIAVLLDRRRRPEPVAG
ncbi:MFS transporter [Rhodococcus koreensis]|uniref:MFS transporter n=1 Tax=Rhodococcus koreensis TaxID=99653 RepID=UPI001F122C0E|nr:MFS transporter [Rhodococcus koreensis]